MSEGRICATCGADITKRDPRAITCSEPCKIERFYVRRALARKAQRLGIPVSEVSL